MSVKIISGKTGYGKTFKAIGEFRSAVKEKCGAFSDAKCYYIVPEQFCVETEAKILESDEIGGIIGGEVISFNRLVLRLLGDLEIKTGDKVSSTGKMLILVDIIRKNNSKLVFFKDAYEKPATTEKLLETISECRKYDIKPDDLINIADESDERNYAKLTETALILREYNALFESKIFDVQSYYSFISEEIEKGNTDISESYIWIDSFSGFTTNELKLLTAFAKISKGLTICLTKGGKGDVIYNAPNDSYNEITGIFTKNHISFTEENTDSNDVTRFTGKDTLKRISDGFMKYYKSGNKMIPDKNQLQAFSCRNFYAELLCLCKNITELVSKGYEFSDIAVVVPDLDEVAFTVQGVFQKYKIPHFIDAKADISGHPAIRYIYSFLNVLGKKFKVKDVLEMLKTGMYKPESFTMECVDKLEKELTENGVKDERTFKKYYEFCQKKGKTSILLQDIALDFLNDDGYLAKSKNCKTVSDVLNLTLEFCEKTKLSETLTSMSTRTDDSFVKVWNTFVLIVHECKQLLGETTVSKTKLVNYVAKLLMNAISNYRLGIIPTSKNVIQIGNVARSRYSDKKVIYVLGANNGKFPKVSNLSGFISDTDRLKLRDNGIKSGCDDKSRIFLDIFNVYAVLTSPSEKLCLSFSRVDADGKEAFPSDALKNLFGANGLFEYEPETFYENHFDGEDYSYDTNVQIEPGLVRSIRQITDVFKTSITSLQNYNDCGYKYFVEKVLGA